MPESYTGQVVNGAIVLDDGASIPPVGTRVRVETITEDQAVEDLSRRLPAPAGKAKGLPPDFAEQHDHYVHGRPKR